MSCLRTGFRPQRVPRICGWPLACPRPDSRGCRGSPPGRPPATCSSCPGGGGCCSARTARLWRILTPEDTLPGRTRARRARYPRTRRPRGRLCAWSGEPRSRRSWSTGSTATRATTRSSPGSPSGSRSWTRRTLPSAPTPSAAAREAEMSKIKSRALKYLDTEAVNEEFSFFVTYNLCNDVALSVRQHSLG